MQRATTGRIRVIVGTVPAAGAEITETVPAGVIWRLISFKAHLLTSGAVANRVPNFTIDNGAVVFYRNGVPFNVPAGTNIDLFLEPGVIPTPLIVAQALITAPFDLLLLPGHVIRTVTTLIDVADQYSAIVYEVEEIPA